MHKSAAIFISLGLAGALSACAVPPAKQAALVTVAPVITKPVPTPPAPPQIVAAAPQVTGLASWYRTGRRLHRTYSGQMLNNDEFTAASSVLPMGTMVRVERVDEDRSVVVRVNDRMPYNHRVIDLSEIAARELGLMGCGVATVTITPVEVASEH
jgi:rare lipoprotein A (peptidoglycan hydrolase)